MGILIDARLEQNEPRIYLRSRSGKILMHWSGAKVRHWLENGDICARDLYSSEYTWLDFMASTRD